MHRNLWKRWRRGWSRGERDGPAATSSPDGLVGLGDGVERIACWLRAALDVRARWRAERRALARRPPERRAALRTLSVAGAIFASVFLLGALLDWIEPFGLDNATKAHSSRISARVMAPFYRSPAQDHIAVVLIDEASLSSRGQPWPPRYDYYASVVRRIVREKPRAVYVDIMTADRRDYDESLEDARAALAQGLAEDPVPLWWGTVSPAVSSVFGDVPGVALATAGWRGLGEAYPLVIAPGNQLIEARKAGAPAASPAWLLYQAACSTHAPGCSAAASAMPREAASQPMALHWGSSRPQASANTPGRTGRCTTSTPPGLAERAGAALRAGWNSFRSGADESRLDDTREQCAYALTIFEEELDDPDVAALLQDRVVLVGGHLAAVNDSVISPVHQRLPGVYMHAMALDNLMTWGADRLRPQPVAAKSAMLAVAVIMALGIAFALRHAAGLCRRLILLCIALAGTIGVSALLHGVLRQPPGDWLGLIGLFALVFTAVRPERTPAEGD